VILSKIESC